MTGPQAYLRVHSQTIIGLGLNDSRIIISKVSRKQAKGSS